MLGGLDRGGAETMIMNLYRNIDRENLQFDFIIHTDKKCDYEDEITSLGGNVYTIPRYKGKNHLQYIKAWHNFFRQNTQYKIVHGHMRSTAYLYLSIAKKYGLKTIAHSHNTSSGKGFPSLVKSILQYPIRYNADYLLACSKYAGLWLFGKKACEMGNFYVLNNAIDTKKFNYNEKVREYKREELGIKDKFVIGHIGRFHEQKNHEYLIDIFSSVYKKNKDAVLILVGDGPKKNAIMKKVDMLGLTENVLFTGVRTDIPELFQTMDIFVFPSLYEGLPVTLIEAQASGLQCIIADNITKEVNITGAINYISITKPSSFWAEEIINRSRYTRQSTSTTISEAGYDVKLNAKWLQNFYQEIQGE
ncbi:glycosyltransferase family 1 protein [Mesobacillus maritimus]|uniref:glycosyltransferase family 1 protein n=1 Tax=Mesobacillus maritimus TaxID=1643336 RepID=UPI0031BB457F